jgi:hypothetical protein
MRRRIAALVAMAMMVLMMSAAPALAHHDVGHANNGNQRFDGGDANEGGGQEKPKNENRKRGQAE